MMLVDTSVWIDHLRAEDPVLSAALKAARVMTHPFVIGEISMGSIRQRGQVLGALRGLPRVISATDDEVSALVECEVLHGLGVGYVDVHLLASVRLTPGSTLWTRDRRLLVVATRFGVATHVAH